MANDAVLAETITFIADQLDIPPQNITATSNVADLVSDSIKLFELLVAFEQKYQTKVSYEDVVNIHTVDDIVQYIERITA